ncbi:MAG: sigma-54-dependent Fis family transcriptional regulator [Candidatus Delongbacteria bacterium]|nr:sigma-54-dependent Fis family transcriptional regulator [Candidatus Delongbacteria bacterium]
MQVSGSDQYASLRAYLNQDYVGCCKLADQDLLQARDPAHRAELLFRKSWSLVKTRRYREAIASYYSLLHAADLQDHCPYFKVYYNLSIAYYYLHMWESSHQALQRATEYGTTDPYGNAYVLFQLFDLNKRLGKNRYEELFQQGVDYFHQVEDPLQRNRLLRMMLYCSNSYTVEVLPPVELIRLFEFGLDQELDQQFQLSVARHYLAVGDFPGYRELISSIKPVDEVQQAILELHQLHYRVLTEPDTVTEAELNVYARLEYQEVTTYFRYLQLLLRPEKPLSVNYLPSHFNMIGASAAMMLLVEQIEKLRYIDENVLITGESGTGKELVARALHYFSHRASHPFVPVNIAGIPETLFEAELFGSRRGAYTGASQDRSGLIQQADGGTLFLDEIGELPLTIQPKLLRFLETHQYREVGGSQSRRASLRILFATHQDLAARVKEGSFRSDLYYRLNTLLIRIPPLRDRLDDIDFLIEHSLDQLRLKYDRSWEITTAARQLLREYHYPGNVRELKNILTQICLTANGNQADRAELLPLLQREESHRSELFTELSLREQLRRYEQHLIQKSVRDEGGDYDSAARRLGISTRSLYRKLQQPDSPSSQTENENRG